MFQCSPRQMFGVASTGTLYGGCRESTCRGRRIRAYEEALGFCPAARGGEHLNTMM